MSKKRYVYIVTRYCYNERKGCHSIPNLSVSTNKKEANRHFEHILKYRKEAGGKILHDYIPGDGLPDEIAKKELRVALIDNKEWGMENLMLERWRIK